MQKSRILIAIIILLAAGIIFIVAAWIYTIQNEKNKREYMLEQLRCKEELEPLMEEARGVMRGEKMATDALEIYNFKKEGYYENVKEIDANANIVVADIKGNEGTIVVDYEIDRLNGNKKKISWAGGLCIWNIYKDTKNEWRVARIPYPEGADEEVEEINKMMKKMFKYKMVDDNWKYW